MKLKIVFLIILFVATNVFVVNVYSQFSDVTIDTENITTEQEMKSGLKNQQKQITGKITDETGASLPGASVQIKGTTTGTMADANGEYSIVLQNDDDVLIFSYVGYVSQEVSAAGKTVIDISLEPSVTGLDEIVVIGYGTQRKGDVTSAVSHVESESFTKGYVRDAAQLVQGKVAGLTVSAPSGDPTASTEILLRGVSTLKSSTQPLILIDGVPGTLQSVAPEDIESIDILKDGSAAAIYGTRGTNGVILITTRKIEAVSGDRVSLQYNSYMSVQTLKKKLDFLTADEFRKYISEGVTFTDYGGEGTDWLEEIMRPLPFSHTQNLTLTGGNLRTNYTASINYREWQGLFLRTNTDQLSGRLDINHSMWDGKLRFNLNANARKREYWAGLSGSGSIDAYGYALGRNPTDDVKDENGDWIMRNELRYENPVALIMETNGLTTESEERYSGNVVLTPINNLEIKLLLANVQRDTETGYSETKQHTSTVKAGRNGYASISNRSYTENLLELTGTYFMQFGLHRFVMLGGYSYQDSKSSRHFMDNWDFPTDQYSYNKMESGYALGRGEAAMSSYAESDKLIGFFGRISYNWDDKYLVMASIREEGSSKFGENHKWGFFPSLSIGWRINKEKFMENVDAVNDLKLRAGFGVTGVAPSSPYMSLTSLNYGSRGLWNGEWIQGLTPVRNANPDLRWERKKEYNLGVDFSIFSNRISGNIDLYYRLTEDMLWDYQVPVPPYLYTSITANVGTMMNKGVEALINFNLIRRPELNWNTSVSFSTNVNELVSLNNDLYETTNDWFMRGSTGGPINEPTHRVQIGYPIGNFYTWKTIDIGADGVWIVEGANGEPQSFQNTSEDDKHYVGNGLPKYYAGFNNNIRYKQWELNVTMRGAFGFEIVNIPAMILGNPTITTYNVLKSAFDDVYGKTRLTSDLQYVSYYIEKGDYWKVDNVTLAYDFKVNNSVISNARCYVSGLNLFTITGYTGIDPEVSSTGLTPGVDDRYRFPTTRTFTLGVNLTF